MSNYSSNKMVDDPNHVWNKLANFIPDGSEILDVGCSSANFGEALITQKDCVVDGVEPDVADAKIAAKKLRQVWVFDIEYPANIASIKKKYDVVVFADVLEHLLHPAETLKKIKVLLKPGGRVVFSVPNMAHISVRLSLLAGDFTYTETGLLDKTHLHFYDIDTVKATFNDADMQLTDLDGVIYGYPDALIRERLQSLGFKAEEAGMGILRDPRAAIFQYVGCAQYDKKPGKKAATISSNMTVLSRDIQNLVDELQAKQEQIATMHSDIEELHKQITDLAASPEYKFGKAVVTPVRKVKSALTRHDTTN